MPRERLIALAKRHADTLVATLVALVIAFIQSPGLIAADTKLDLTADPVGFLARAAHLWTPTAPLGQVQNQAYGYFFPHGLFFAAGDLAHLPPWVTQRLWWALLLVTGFIGVVRLAQALGVGSPGSRVIAGALFVLSPRVLTTLGSISSETLPMMLAPWVLVPVVRALDQRGDDAEHRAGHVTPLWCHAFRSAFAVALMGAVNAVATAAALGVAGVWYLLAARRGRSLLRRWWRFGAAWVIGLVLACAWWCVPLVILSRVSPPFLDFIESSRVTTQWASLTEVLRGTASWTPYVSPDRVAGAVLVTEPAAVVATGILVAAGLAGLCMRHMPFRGRWVTILVVGLLVMCTGYVGALGSPIAESVREFLDGPGAFLRNIHKFEPFIRLPLVLGVAHLLARVPLPGTAGVRQWLAAFAHPQRSRAVAATVVVVVSLIGAGSLMWTGQLAPAGAYQAIPSYWRQTAHWLDTHSTTTDAGIQKRALVVPGAPFAEQLWGMTRDEPLQALASSPWAVRDAIPLTPPGAIRALDSVQQMMADGHGSPGLAATLAGQGIGFVVLRADLDPDSSRSARPLLTQQTLETSPGIRRVAVFGPRVSQPTVAGVVRDNGLRPAMRAIQIYAVQPAEGTGPDLSDTAAITTIAGGPESIATLQDLRARIGEPPIGPAVLAGDAATAGLGGGPVVLTDSPANRETDFGRVDDHSSAIRTPDDPRRTKNAAPDYPVPDESLTQGQWLLDNQPDQVRVSTSGSASDATQPGQTSPANSAAAAFDSNPTTAWVSSGLTSAVGQWMRLDFTTARTDLALKITTAKALGPDVTSVLVTTEAGSTVVSGLEPGKTVSVTAPAGPTRWVQIGAIAVDNGSAGNQFALGEVALVDLASGQPLSIRHRVVLPTVPADTKVAGWLLTQGLSGRSSCVATRGEPDTRIRCASGLGLSPESPGIMTRALSVPTPTAVRPTVLLRPSPGDGLNALLRTPHTITASGASEVNDPRGSAQAAVDGDPGTIWTAAEPKRKKDRPTLTITLPKAQEVTSLRIVAAAGYPAAPTEVSVDLGTGRQRRTVGSDGIVHLNRAVTDHITIAVIKREDLLDVNSLGFVSPAPVGIAEVQVTPAPQAPPTADRPITIGCDAGIGITVSGHVIPMSVATTAAALRAGEPVVATPCARTPTTLGRGEQELSVNPGQAFTVDTVWLDAGGPVPAAAISRPPVLRWDATAREVRLDQADTQRVLSVPESTNSGWIADLNGHRLTPVVVDGWQQGWVVPAGQGGTLHLSYPLDGVYRWSLLIGFALLALLAVFTVVIAPRRATRTQIPVTAAAPPPPRAVGLVAAGAWIAGSWLLTGWWGVAVSVAVAVVIPRLPARTLPVATTLAMLCATVGLATGPWHANTGYHGTDWWVQLSAFTAVSLTVVGAIYASFPAVARKVRALSRRRTH